MPYNSIFNTPIFDDAPNCVFLINDYLYRGLSTRILPIFTALRRPGSISLTNFESCLQMPPPDALLRNRTQKTGVVDDS